MTAEILTNPVTGEAMTVRESSPEIFKIQYTMAPRGRIAVLHYHPFSAQIIRVLAGEM